MIYEWNDWNIDHIAKHGVAHGVAAAEAKFVIDHAEPPFPRQIENEKHLVWGQTAAARYLPVIFVYLADEDVDFLALSQADQLEFERGAKVRYVIHAMEMTQDQKKQYRRLRR